MFHSALETLEYPQVIRLLQLEAKSEPGRDALERRRPATTLAAAELLQSQLAEMVRYYHTEGLLPLAGVVSTRRVFESSEFGLPEAWSVVRALRATQAVREALVRARDGYPRLLALGEAIPQLDPLVTNVGRYFTRDGKLREEASATLRTLRTRIQTKRSAIQKSLAELMNRNADAIQEPIITIRADRYVVPVRADRRNDVPGILHERSGSGASFFIEPLSIIDANNDLADLLIQEREEIARIVRDIARQLFGAADEINAAIEVVGEIDAIQACAVFADILEASRPSFTLERRLELRDARHPLLDERLADARSSAFGERGSSRVVPSTIRLGPDSRTLVISGPNAGGKTVALKTAGLLVAMALSGLPLPARDGSVIPVVDALHVTIGDDQNLLESLSTFSAYLVRLKRVLEHATERSLVLLDELGSGTDPEEGSALAAAVIEHLTRVGAMAIVTTHLTALKSFAIDDARILNASMEFDPETGRPTFRLVEGLPGRSRAIETARMVGIPMSVVEAAKSRLGADYGKIDHLVAELQRRLADAAAERQATEAMRKELEFRAAALESEREKLEAERNGLAAIYRDETDRLKSEVQSRLSSEIRLLRESDRQAREKIQLKDVVDRVTTVIPAVAQENRETPNVGDEVEHRRFKIVGTVKSIDGKRAQIVANGKSMTVDLADLTPRKTAQPKKKPASADVSRSSGEATVGAELNLVGQRVEDAIEESDRFLDRALLTGTQAVRLIHGFGTGTLRKALREYLRKHPAVKSYRPGADNEGGDGATIAILDV